MSISLLKSSRILSKLDAVLSFPPLEFSINIVSDPNLKLIAEKLRYGVRLDRVDGLALIKSNDISALGAMAYAARLAKNGRYTFYILNRHVNYSNICLNKCIFCAFWRNVGHKQSFLLSPTEVAARVQKEQYNFPVDEFHIVGSCPPNLDFSYYFNLISAISAIQPQATLKAFTPVEIDHLAYISNKPVDELLKELQSIGLAAMPGGGAEIFSPKVRTRFCPRKISGKRWLKISAIAHSLGIPTNATMLYGHIETADDLVDHLLALRKQQDQSFGFSAFVPLAFHPINTAVEEISLSSSLNDLRIIAASRLLLDNFPHIKAYWVMLGSKLAQLALNFGADDLDGTVVEECITHTAGATSARGLTEADLRRMIIATGLIPIRRDTFYDPLV